MVTWHSPRPREMLRRSRSAGVERLARASAPLPLIPRPSGRTDRLSLADGTAVILSDTLKRFNLYSLSDPHTGECATVALFSDPKSDRRCSRISHGDCVHLWSQRTKHFLSECMRETATHKRATIESALRKRHQNIFFTRVRGAISFRLDMTECFLSDLPAGACRSAVNPSSNSGPSTQPTSSCLKLTQPVSRARRVRGPHRWSWQSTFAVASALL